VIAALLPRLVIWLWFFAALLAGPSLLLRFPAAGLPIAVAIVTIACLRLAARVESLQRWVAAIPLRSLVLLHVGRTAGLGLLILHVRGVLDGDFAAPVGLGELAIGIMALPVALAPLSSTQRMRATSVWNIAGFTELLLAVTLATRLAENDSDFLHHLALPPTVVLPLFVLPLLAASHVVIFLRTRRQHE
jgi:hypothetical protein